MFRISVRTPSDAYLLFIELVFHIQYKCRLKNIFFYRQSSWNDALLLYSSYDIILQPYLCNKSFMVLLYVALNAWIRLTFTVLNKQKHVWWQIRRFTKLSKQASFCLFRAEGTSSLYAKIDYTKQRLCNAVQLTIISRNYFIWRPFGSWLHY